MTTLLLIFGATFAVLRAVEAIREPIAARKAARIEREWAAWSRRGPATRLGKLGMSA